MNQDRKDSLRKNRNLKILEYDPIDDNHSGLVKELKQLSILVEEKRQDMALYTSW